MDHPGAAYFVTTVTADRKPLLMRRGMVQRLLADLWIALRIKETECYAVALLPDHAHLILRPKGSHSLSDFMHSWKRNSSRNANRLFTGIGFRWQESFREHVLRDEKDLLSHYRYVLGNPNKHGGIGFAKCFPEGIVNRKERRHPKDHQDACSSRGQDLYPGLQGGEIAVMDQERARFVYDLYGLTVEDIAIVEGEGK
jgi:REP element-mobilizing transposase RayT